MKKEYLIWAVVNPKGVITDVSLSRAAITNTVNYSGGKKAGWSVAKIKGPQPWFAGQDAQKTKVTPARKTTKGVAAKPSAIAAPYKRKAGKRA